MKIPGIIPNLAIPKKEHLLIAVCLFLAVILFSYFHILDRLEFVTYDYRFKIKELLPASDEIVIIEIAEDSIDKIGRWPWDRDWHTTIIGILKEFGAKTIAMDIIFSEPSGEEKDKALALSIKDHGHVFLPVVIDNFNPNTQTERKLINPIPILSDSMAGTGHINVMPDMDGTIRRVPALIEYQNKKVPHIALSVAFDYLGIKLEEITSTSRRINIPSENKRSLSIPMDGDGNILLNWSGTWGNSFRHVSYFDVIDSYMAIQKGEKPHLSPEIFRNKICFIGGTAIGLADIRPTPLQPNYPAVGVNMTLLSNILQGRYIKPLSQVQNAGILIAIFLALLLIMKTEHYFKSAFFIFVLAVAYVLFAIGMFTQFNIWINIVYPLSLITSMYLVLTLYNQFQVVIEKKKLFNLATKDSLTDLYNVGHFKLLFKAEFTSFKLRPEKKLSIILSDIDNFKKINDTYGHLTGDLVLKETAQIMKNNCRALDVPARYGGEELIIMLPGADLENAAKIAEKIRIALSEKTFPAKIMVKGEKVFAYYEKSSTFNVTLSIGVAEATMVDGEIEHIIARADKALYEAKNSGKNKVAIAPNPKV